MVYYIIKSSLALLLFLGYYWFFLRKDTTFHTNRIYLLSTLILSLLLPLLHFPWRISNETIRSVNYAITPIHINTQNPFIENHTSWWTLKHVLFVLYGSGLFLIFMRYIKQITPWIKLVFTAKGRYEGLCVIKTDKSIPPFSFINTVFIGNQEYTPEELNNIISHEKQHIRQYHWIDLLIVDMVSILFWFNPLIWIYDLLIKQNHEYLADHGVIAQGFKKSRYQALLLQQVVGVKIPGLSNSFTHSLIKNRFIMMTKKNSRKIAGIKALLALPLLVFLTVLFSSNTNRPLLNETLTGLNDENVSGHVYDFSTGKPLERASVVFKNSAIGCSTDANGFFRLKNTNNYSKLIVSYVGYKTAVVNLKKGEIKVLMKKANYSVESRIKNDGAVEYNILPAPPPPPPIEETSRPSENIPPPPPSKEEKEVFMVVEDIPCPENGFEGLSDYINKQVIQQEQVEFKGKKVMVYFVINEKGLPENVRVKESSGNKNADELAVDIIKHMPTWKPGSQHGKNVPVAYTIDVYF